MCAWYLENSRIIAAVRMTTYAGTLLPHGGTTHKSLTRKTMSLSGDALVRIETTYSDEFHHSSVLSYLKLESRNGKVLTIGSPLGKSCNITVPDGYQIVGFYGRAAWYIDSLGAVASPI